MELMAVGGAAPASPPVDPNVISDAAGTEARSGPDGVVRITWDRTDVEIEVSGMPVQPAAGLTSWAAFTSSGHGVMVMGDTVVFEDEVSPAIDAAFEAGLSVTAIHNHFLFDEPKVYFMHIAGEGGARNLAEGVRGVWDAIRRVRDGNRRPARRFPGPVPKLGPIDSEKLARILGHPVTVTNGVVKMSVGREGKMHGTSVGGSMGLSSWAAFSGSDELAAVDGDFIMTSDEVQPVLRALRKEGIHVVALHNHMIGEEPAFYFTHFWGIGPAVELAGGVRKALDLVTSGEGDP